MHRQPTYHRHLAEDIKFKNTTRSRVKLEKTCGNIYRGSVRTTNVGERGGGIAIVERGYRFLHGY